MDNVAGSLRHAHAEIQGRQLDHFFRADARYGEGVARRLGVSRTGVATAAE